MIVKINKIDKPIVFFWFIKVFKLFLKHPLWFIIPLFGLEYFGSCLEHVLDDVSGIPVSSYTHWFLSLWVAMNLFNIAMVIDTSKTFLARFYRSVLLMCWSTRAIAIIIFFVSLPTVLFWWVYNVVSQISGGEPLLFWGSSVVGQGIMGVFAVEMLLVFFLALWFSFGYLFIYPLILVGKQGYLNAIQLSQWAFQVNARHFLWVAMIFLWINGVGYLFEWLWFEPLLLVLISMMTYVAFRDVYSFGAVDPEFGAKI